MYFLIQQTDISAGYGGAIYENQVADIFHLNISHRDIILGLNAL